MAIIGKHNFSSKWEYLKRSHDSCAASFPVENWFCFVYVGHVGNVKLI